MFLQRNASMPEVEHSIRALLAEQLIAAIASAPHVSRITSGLDKNDLLAMTAGVGIFFQGSEGIRND